MSNKLLDELVSEYEWVDGVIFYHKTKDRLVPIQYVYDYIYSVLMYPDSKEHRSMVRLLLEGLPVHNRKEPKPEPLLEPETFKPEPEPEPEPIQLPADRNVSRCKRIVPANSDNLKPITVWLDKYLDNAIENLLQLDKGIKLIDLYYMFIEEVQVQTESTIPTFHSIKRLISTAMKERGFVSKRSRNTNIWYKPEGGNNDTKTKNKGNMV